MENLNIRKVKTFDAPVVAAILTDAVRRKLYHGDTAWGSGEFTIEEMQRLIEKSPTYLAYQNGDAVGTVALQWEDTRVWGDQPPVAGYIHRLAIKEGCEGQGMGEKIISWAGNEVSLQGRRLLRLDCDEKNEKLCAYYERLGFKKVGIKDLSEDGYIAALYELATKS